MRPLRASLALAAVLGAVLLLTPAVAAAEPAATAPSSTGALVMFWLLAGLTVGGALVTISRRNAISAVMALVATFFGLAAMYAMLSAHFLAAIQILVYAGAIMTLFVFVVMVLNRDEAEPWALRGVLTKALGIAAIVYFTVKSGAFLFADVPAKVEPPPPEWGGVASVGELLFTQYLFPFEALSLMLLIAVIGAVVVARTPKKQEDHAGGLAHAHEHDDNEGGPVADHAAGGGH